MSFTIESEEAAAGQEVTVEVRTRNNPGFLTMAVEIEYDEKTMILTKIENGIDFSKYNYIPPKKLKTGCKASWFITDLPSNSTDGELLKLHFFVFDNTKAGKYPITISPVNDGGIVDGNKKLITVADSTDVITVK